MCRRSRRNSPFASKGQQAWAPVREHPPWDEVCKEPPPLVETTPGCLSGASKQAMADCLYQVCHWALGGWVNLAWAMVAGERLHDQGTVGGGDGWERCRCCGWRFAGSWEALWNKLRELESSGWRWRTRGAVRDGSRTRLSMWPVAR
jgi:hypothetical protein